MRQLVITLNAEGVPTVRGGTEWRPSSLYGAIGQRPAPRTRREPSAAGGQLFNVFTIRRDRILHAPHRSQVGHAGAGSTLIALAAGVPMALVPLFADQPFNARRVAELGAAIALDDGPESLPALEPAVSELLSDARYRDRAKAIAKEIQSLAAVDEAPRCSRHYARANLHPQRT